MALRFKGMYFSALDRSSLSIGRVKIESLPKKHIIGGIGLMGMYIFENWKICWNNLVKSELAPSEMSKCPTPQKLKLSEISVESILIMIIKKNTSSACMSSQNNFQYLTITGIAIGF